MRYVQGYRCEAIQCRGDNIRYVSQDCTSTLDCFAAFHQLRIASAVAASQRRAGLAQPCPGAMRRDGGRSYAAHGAGKPPRRLRTAPLHRGDKDEGYDNRRTPPPTSNPYPLCGGVPPQRRGGFPRRARPTS
ncbi:MAG: hypothetical protein LBM98_04510 [Oscillospiraceae bacterium]|nr:hypothetical protein [Oscillospiraceae bacterium]